MTVFNNIFYSIRRYFVDEFFIDTVARLEKDVTVLDIGGHKGRKRGRFDIHQQPLRVLVVNLSVRHGADVVCDAAFLPFATGSADAVICGEMLEHVPDPRLILAEAARVLKPGGLFLATVPFLFQVHADPQDFGRYTQTFWEQHFPQAGLEIDEIRPQGGYCAVMACFIHSWLLDRHKACNRLPPWRRRASHAGLAWLARLVCRVGMHLDRQTAAQTFHRAYTTGYGLIGRKPMELTP
jgi:SAM-dependent methyltransferase